MNLQAACEAYQHALELVRLTSAGPYSDSLLDQVREDAEEARKRMDLAFIAHTTR